MLQPGRITCRNLPSHDFVVVDDDVDNFYDVDDFDDNNDVMRYGPNFRNFRSFSNSR